jgi:hypothetical protein
LEQAVSILDKMPVQKELIQEDEAAEFSEKIAKEVETHEKVEA